MAGPLVRQMGVSHVTWDGYVREITTVSEPGICASDPVAALYLEGDGAALREMFKDPAVLMELMVASGMVGDELVEEELRSIWEAATVADQPLLPSEVLEEIEWAECCEPSHFKEHDFSTGHDVVMTDGNGNPILHDAQKHEQRCSLNDLLNRTCGSWAGTVRTEDWEKNWVYSLGITCECTLVSIGEAYGVGICDYGAVWVPKSCAPYLPGLGETFRASAVVSCGGRYPLRVIPRGIH